MQACVISHTYVARDNREKWRSLGRRGLATIDLHLPACWPSWEERYLPISESEPGLQTHTSSTLRSGHEDQYFFFPDLLRGLRKSQVDILHVEQGAGAFVYYQALWEQRLFSKKTRTCFFTWINWETPLRWPWTWIEPSNLRHSHGAIGGNSEAVDLLRQHGFRGKTAVIPQIGVDPDFYSPGDATDLRKQLSLDRLVIGFVGRLVEEKGIRLLMEAMPALKTPAILLLVGDGPEVRRWSEDQRFERRTIPQDTSQQVVTEFLPKTGSFKTSDWKMIHVPAVSHDAVRNYLRCMDILTLPSFSIPSWKEQFGHVLIEAMACEIPVLGSTAAAIPDVIGDAGVLFQEKQTGDLASKLNDLLASSSLRKQWGTKGRQRILTHYTHDRVAEQTLDFWKQL